MLINLVNDVKDLKMIGRGVYENKVGKFKPKDVFNFILSIFAP